MSLLNADGATNQRMQRSLDAIAKDAASRVSQRSWGRTNVEYLWEGGVLVKVTVTHSAVDDERSDSAKD